MFIVMPVLLAAITGVALLFCKQKRSLDLVHLSGTLLVTLSAVILLFQPSYTSEQGIWLVDALSKYFIAIIAVVYFLAGTYSVRYLLPEYTQGTLNFKSLRMYYCLLHTFTATMLLTVMLNSLGMMWVAIELTTLTSALLVGFYNTKASLEAAWKYIFLCSVGIALALLGVILTFYATENAFGSGGSALNWLLLRNHGTELNPQILKLSFIFIMIGYGTKVGLAPMHTWLPDAHSQAPSPVSAMLSGVLLSCALYGILRFQIIVNLALGSTEFTSGILILIGGFSMLVSLPFIIVQNDVKRLLAYSSIEHMGLITLALGIGGKLAIYGALLHVLFHAIAKSSMFFIAGDFTNHWHTKKISRIKGVADAFPVQGWMAFAMLFALAGSPPFGLFRSELIILGSAVSQGRWPLAVLVLFALVTAFAGLVYHFGRMITGRARPTAKRDSYMQPLFVILPVMVLFVFGLWMPPFIDKAVNAAGLVITGGMM